MGRLEETLTALSLDVNPADVRRLVLTPSGYEVWLRLGTENTKRWQRDVLTVQKGTW